MKKRLLSVLLAMVMVLGMLPGEAWAEDTLEDETRNVMVSTLEELDAIKEPGSTAVMIERGASIVGTDGTSYTFASLTIEEGASLKVSWLNCHGSIVIKGTLETEYDIYCSGNFLLTGGGKLTIGRTLNMYKMNTSLLNLNGTVDYLNRDDMGGVSLWYDALDEFEFLDCLNKAANDTREEYKYWICNSSDLRDVSILLTRNAEIPANTTVSVDTGYQDNSSPGLDIAKGVELVNNGTIMTSSLFSSSSNIGIKGTLVNNGMLSINQSDTLNCSGEIVNNGSLLISGSINITGSLVNNASISVNRLNDSEKGVLTLADGASYSGRKDATISSTYRTGTYRDFITGFDWDLFEIYESDSDLEGVHHVQLSNKRDIEGSEPEGPDTSTDIKLVACSPTVGEEIPYRASSLELKLTFDHEIEGFDFSEGTLHIYEAETGREVYAVRRNGQAADPNRPNGDVKLSYPASNTMTINASILKGQELKPATRYYVTLDEGFIRFKGTDQSTGLTKGDWTFTTGNAEYFSTNAKITFQNGYGIKNTTVSAQWYDAWFLNDAGNVYNHDLATTSMALCGAAYASGADARDALEKFGFTYTKSYNYGRELSEDDCDYVGYTFGSKEIKYVNGETAYLIAVVIRGTAGNEEWYSNFNIGASFGYDHLGFSIAKSRLWEDLKAYLEDAHRGFPDAKANNKFLITGHSRGAAVANLLAAGLSYSDYATADNVYAYTFATPAVSEKAQTVGYENIFNIVTGEDFVPQLPLSKWGFKRYGVDLPLPSQSYYSSNRFTRISEKAYDAFENLTGKNFKAYDGETSAGMIKVSQVVSEMERLAPDVQSFYTSKYDILLRGGIIKNTTPSTYFNIFTSFLVNNSPYNGIAFVDTRFSDFGKITDFFLSNGSDSILGEARAFCAHSPAGYYSWMSACTANELFGRDNGGAFARYDRLTVACPVDVFVYNENGTLVASVIDEEVVENTLAAIAEDGSKIIDLPSDQPYTVKIVAIDNGTVSCTVDEISANGGTSDIQRTVKFNDIAIATGDELHGTIDCTENTPTPNYTLVKNGADLIPADYDSLAPSSYPTYPSTSTTPVNPTSSVGTKPNKPDTPESSTLPFTDVTTAGWYYDAVRFVYEKGIMNGIGNNLFAPNANLSRAQLAQILYNKEGRPAVNGVSSFTDVAAGAWYSDAVIWAAEKNIVGGYGNGLFGPDDNITREQLAVMLWRYAGEPASSFDLTFSDADKISDFALPAIRWAVENGILNGKGNNILDPKGFATRAEVAQMFKNYLG